MRYLIRVLLLLTLASASAGCAEKCFSDGATLRLTVNLGSGIDGSRLERLLVDVTLGQVTRQDEIWLEGRLGDGETSLEVVLGDAASKGFEAKIEIIALDGAGAKVAAASGQASGGAEACVVVRLTLFREQDTDKGTPFTDGSFLDGGPGLDLKKPPKDLKPPPKDFPPIPVDMPVTPADFPPIPVDMPPTPVDLPPTPVDLPPIPADLPPSPADQFVQLDSPPIPVDMPPAPPDQTLSTPEAAPLPDATHSH